MTDIFWAAFWGNVAGTFACGVGAYWLSSFLRKREQGRAMASARRAVEEFNAALRDALVTEPKQTFVANPGDLRVKN